MFGLTQREQRWKAEQQAAEALAALAAVAIEACAQVDAAEAHTNAAELVRLRAEYAEFRRLLARYREETPLAAHPGNGG